MRMKMKLDIKKQVIRWLPYVVLFWFFTKLGESYRLAEGRDVVQRAMAAVLGLGRVFGSALPSFHATDPLVGLCGAVGFRLFVYFKSKNAKKYRKDVEYGSARWGTAEDIAPYMDSKPENNLILTATEALTMNNRPKNPKHARNKNVLVVGGAGSGKTRFFITPNLMQCNSKDYPVSFVVTDPKGQLVGDVGALLKRSGYKIRVLNTINFAKSHKYNPFLYIHSEKDILKLVTALIDNTQGEGKGGDDFWKKSEIQL